MSKVRAEFIGLIIISGGAAADLLPGGAAGIQLEADGTRLVLIMCRLLKTSAQEILFRNSAQESILLLLLLLDDAILNWCIVHDPYLAAEEEEEDSQVSNRPDSLLAWVLELASEIFLVSLVELRHRHHHQAAPAMNSSFIFLIILSFCLLHHKTRI
jgi:hypothetical protein